MIVKKSDLQMPVQSFSVDVKSFDPLRKRLEPLPLIATSLKEQRRILAKKGLREVRELSTTRDVNGQKITREWLTVERIPRKVEVEVVPYDRSKDPEEMFTGTLNNSVTYRETKRLVDHYNAYRGSNGIPVTFEDVQRTLLTGSRK